MGEVIASIGSFIGTSLAVIALLFLVIGPWTQFFCVQKEKEPEEDKQEDD